MTKEQVYTVMYGRYKPVIYWLVALSILVIIGSVFLAIWYDIILGIKIFLSSVFVLLITTLTEIGLKGICKEVADEWQETKYEEKMPSKFQIRLKEMAEKRGIKTDLDDTP